jgi:P4 family phage/plasmid primase-like protien
MDENITPEIIRQNRQILYDFLNMRRKHDEDKRDITHTSMGFPVGKFVITDDDLGDFYILYKKLVGNTTLSIIERPKKVGILVLDFDFKFDSEHSERQYKNEHVEFLVRELLGLIKKYMECDIRNLELYVLEKKNPTHITDNGHDNYKDGFHIVCNVPMDVSVRYFIFDELKTNAKKISLFSDMSLIGENDKIDPYDYVFDKSVISSNGWMMYKSNKPNCQIYNLTRIYDNNCDRVSLEKYDEDERVVLFSIRQHTDDDCVPIKSEFIEDENFRNKFDNIVSRYIAKIPKIEQEEELNNGFGSTNNFDEPLTQNEIDVRVVKDLVKLLSPKRADDYNDWVRVGWALHNVHVSLLIDFKNFSKRCPKKYNEKSCEEIWKKAKNSGLSISSIFYWAQEDSPDEFLGILRKHMREVLSMSDFETHDDIAKAVKTMYSHEFVCSDIKKKNWWQFKNHRWVSSSCGVDLELIITDKVGKELALVNMSTFDRIAHRKSKESQKDDEEKSRKTLESKGLKISNIIMKLGTQGYRNSVMEACARRLFIPNFEDKLDCNKFLIGFNNGIYDLKTGTFRSGSPDDYVSFSVGYNYIEYDEDDEEIQNLMSFFDKIQTEQEMKYYLLRLISSYLVGENKEQQFMFWTGSGCHAKNTKIMMWDGSCKLVQDIRLNEKLMGDDLKPRNVLQLFRGTSCMYKIILDDGSDFIVNRSHRLALISTFDLITQFSEKYDKWIVEWHEYYEHIPIKKIKMFNDKKSSMDFINSLCNHENLIRKNDVIPVFVMNYEKIDETIRKYYKCFRIRVIENDNSYFCKLKKVNNTYRAINLEQIEMGRKMGHLVVNNEISINSEEMQQHNFIIEKLEKDKYYGFEIDKNSRYLLNDGLVTYNSNGKSVLMNLIHATFGDQYYGVFNPTFLTKKRTQSSNATPDIAEKKGKRIVVMSEPDYDDAINAGALKEVTGGDTITARQLYNAPITFKPQFKLIMICNKLPEISSIDGGTWRRIRVVSFESKFVDEPKKPNEFKKIYGMENIVLDWTSAFMWLLINKYYKDYVENGLQEPDKVKTHSMEYQKESNMFYEFMGDNLTIIDDLNYMIPVTECYQEFAAWFKEYRIGTRPGKKDLVNYLMDKGVRVSGNKLLGIKHKDQEGVERIKF